MSDKRRFLVHCDYDTSCWIYDDLHSAEKRLSSGLKAPPNAQDFTIKQVQFIQPQERIFSRDEILKVIGDARNETIKTHQIIDELFASTGEK